MMLHRHYGTKSMMKTTENSEVLRSPYHRGVQAWETLPIEIQLHETKLEFKQAVNKLLH